MARLVDVIEMMIKEMLDENNGAAVINRSDLAERVNCVPSQITYVISTRFTNGQGYIVESRRGGGGQIRISRVQRMPASSYLMHSINSLGDTISQQEAEIFLLNFVDYGVMDQKTARLIKAAISDSIRAKHGSLVGNMASQGTTPRRLTDLIGSLCDLTSGSGDKGTPIVLIQGYFDNYTAE